MHSEKRFAGKETDWKFTANHQDLLGNLLVTPTVTIKVEIEVDERSLDRILGEMRKRVLEEVQRHKRCEASCRG